MLFLFALIEAVLTALLTKILDLLPSTQFFSKFDGDKHVMFHQLDSSLTQYRSTGLVLNVLKLTGLCLQQSF